MGKNVPGRGFVLSAVKKSREIKQLKQWTRGRETGEEAGEGVGS